MATATVAKTNKTSFADDECPLSPDNGATVMRAESGAVAQDETRSPDSSAMSSAN
eukprot:CAMPEP_0169181972 /NCGR_PEP_ID=MMETSP1015-20121227/68972_1 /TAXON_ID=342587 /ORGANISM="Karlodinium micrum, Strain CCMP2283" /LENGTH=54 /DNA_ID=CAMNT_0009257149 /DNA_START=411 /DNA_END=575 /DNA_ORIENTATION=+